ncbi:MAG TPA: polysaccharide biosynthesis tyrosine autokinase [Bacteroidales bacterium]|nr:polysaccharide biosynthesis tyrosine autokinase [Bacteroidales bacterium]
MSEYPENTQDQESINIRELLFLFLANWRWFVLSIVILLSMGTGYILIKSPVYTRSTSILIKEDKKGNSLNSSTEMFADMGLLKSNTNLKNEMLIIKSPMIIEEVVKRLRLDLNYTVKHRWVRNIDLYTSSPVVVELDSLIGANQTVSFTIEPISQKKVKIYNINWNDRNYNNEQIIVLGVPTKTPCGVLTINPTVSFSHKYFKSKIYFSKNNVKNVAGSYTSRLKVELGDKDASIINMTLNDISATRAEEFLNTLIAIYNEKWLEDKNQISVNTSLFINERLQVIETDLGLLDNNISTYKSANLLPDLQAVSTMVLTQSSTTNSQILTLNNQLSMARYVQEYMKKGTTANQLLPSNSGIGSTNIEQQINIYNTTLLQKNKLLANSSEQNPIIQDLNQTLSSMKQAILRSIDDYIETLKIQINNTVKSEQRTNAQIANNPDQAKYLISVERQQKVKEALYVFLLQKREENELSRTFTSDNTRMVNPPSGDSSPTSPKRSLIFLITFAIGLIIPGLVIFIVEQLNTMVKDKKDLHVLSVPFLSEIPYHDSRKRRKFYQKWTKKELEDPTNIVVVEEHNRNHINEAFRILRTNIDFVQRHTDGATVSMITSIHSGAGKTFISSNIGKSMAIKGSRVLLIDFDMRKATLSKIISPQKLGVANYLNGEVSDPLSIVVKGELNEHLDVIPVGTIPPNPAELLLRPTLVTLIEKLKAHYDYIFLDSPPIDIITDADLIAKVADYTIFVVRAGLLDKRLLPDIESAYQGKRFPNMGIILNCSDLALHYGYGRYGGYGHYGGYGRYGYSYHNTNAYGA